MAKLLALLLLSLLTWHQPSLSQNNRGVSFIGQMCSPNADCEAIKKSFRYAKTINVGWLNQTFNPNGCKCAKAILSDPRPKNVRIHICNGTCFASRGRQCQKYECFYGYTVKQADRAISQGDSRIWRKIKQASRLAKASISGTRNANIFISPVLESEFSKASRRQLLSLVSKSFPSATLVDNPLKDSCIDGVVCEKHGDVKSQIADLDGIEASEIDNKAFARKNKKSIMTLLWKKCANGIKDKFVTPLKRKDWCHTNDILRFQRFTSENYKP